mmetsp:Transcript_9477/g.17727  ORF Transcript_9477/g.17727 Transcript_9477/m.17727 type:complete len:211 (+) Transcript_9477:304-936(+)
MKNSKHSSQSLCVSNGTVKHVSSSKVGRLALLVESHAAHLRRGVNLLVRRLNIAHESTGVGSHCSSAEPNSVQLKRIHVEVVCVCFHVRERLGDLKTRKSFDEWLLSNWANNRSRESEIVSQKLRLIATVVCCQELLGKRKQLFCFDRKRGVLQHLLLVHCRVEILLLFYVLDLLKKRTCAPYSASSTCLSGSGVHSSSRSRWKCRPALS